MHKSQPKVTFAHGELFVKTCIRVFILWIQIFQHLADEKLLLTTEGYTISKLVAFFFLPKIYFGLLQLKTIGVQIALSF